MATDPRFNNWEAALAASAKGERYIGFANEHPDYGFFRFRDDARAPWRPYAMLPDPEDDAAIVYEVDGKSVGRNHAIQVWSRACGHPVTWAAYEGFLDGKGWPDVDPGAAPAERGVGDNSQNAVEEVVDPVDAAKKSLEAAKSNIDAYKVITSDEQLASARSLQNKLLEIRSESEKSRKAEKQPHWDKAVAVDKKWNPVITEAETAAKSVLAAMNTYGTLKLQQQRAAEAAAAKAEADRIAAEQKKAKEEAAAAAAEAAKLAPALDEAFGPAIVETKPAPAPLGDFGSFGEAPAPKPKPAAIAAPIRPGYGRAASFVPVFKLTQVTDYDALYAFLKNLPEVQTVLRERAQILINQGTREIPGCTIEEQAGLK